MHKFFIHIIALLTLSAVVTTPALAEQELVLTGLTPTIELEPQPFPEFDGIEVPLAKDEVPSAMDEWYSDFDPIIFTPAAPPEKAYEIFSEVRRNIIEDPEFGEIEVCEIVLTSAMLGSKKIPVDEETGHLKIDFKGKFLTAEEAILQIDPETCAVR